MDDKGRDREQIEALFGEIRGRMAKYLQSYHEFFPGTFDGNPSVPKGELLKSCKVVQSRADIIRAIPSGGRFAEVGTLWGDFAAEIVDLYEPSELHLFDHTFENIKAANREKLKESKNVFYHLGDSSSSLSKIDSSYFDVVYVDGDHSFTGIWKDLNQSLRVLKPTGYLICNDYTNWDPIQCSAYGVFAAVNAFANAHNLSFEFVGLHPMGFHDVAMKNNRVS